MAINVNFIIKEKEVDIDGTRYTVKSLERKLNKTKLEMSILHTMYQLYGEPKKEQLKLAV